MKLEICLKMGTCRKERTVALDFEYSASHVVSPESKHDDARKQIASVECSISCILYRKYVHSGNMRNITKFKEFCTDKTIKSLCHNKFKQ